MSPRHRPFGGRRDRGAAARRRLRGEAGTALVTAAVLLFSFTGAAVIVLARDYGERISTRATAQQIAFQAARVGAQQIAPSALREGDLAIDQPRAIARSTQTAETMLAEHGRSGKVTVVVDGDLVTVVVEVVDQIEEGFASSREAIVTASGSARAVRE